MINWKYFRTFYATYEVSDEDPGAGGAEVAIPGNTSTKKPVRHKTILEQLRELIGKKNAKMISEAFPEQMSGGGVFIVHEDENTVLDKTWQEIYDAALVMPVILISAIEKDDAIGVMHNTFAYITNSKGHVVRFFAETGGRNYTADDANSYPRSLL